MVLCMDEGVEPSSFSLPPSGHCAAVIPRLKDAWCSFALSRPVRVQTVLPQKRTSANLNSLQFQKE